MAFWKQKYNRTDGFSLVEIVVAITILGFVAVPMLTGLLFSYQLNQRSEEKMQAQLAVSSAVETIMAEGYNNTATAKYDERFPDVEVEYIGASGAAHQFKVTAYNLNSPPDENGKPATFDDISVTTYARPYNGGDEGE